MNKNTGMKCPKTHATGEECAGCPECFSALPEAGSMKPRALLYTETVNEVAVRRDDLWIVTTAYVNAAAPSAQPAGAPSEKSDAGSLSVNAASAMREVLEKIAYYDGGSCYEGRVMRRMAQEALEANAALAAQPAGAASTAAVRDAALEAVAAYDDPHTSMVGVSRAIGNLRELLGLPEPTIAQPADQQAVASVAQPVPADAALADMEARKDAAYYERNQVVAALAKCFPSGVARTAIEGWSEDWHGCVYIDLPTGQVSWHFHDSQAHLFAGLPAYAGTWDGHSTDEKYARLAALSAAPVAQPVPAAAEIPLLPRGKMLSGMDLESLHVLYSVEQMRERDAMWSARVRAALASHSAVPVAQGEPVAWVKFLDDSIVIDEYCITTGGPGDTYENEEWRPVYTAPVAPKEAQPSQAVPAELIGVAEQIKAGAGFWHSCSGCHDTEDGHPTGNYHFSVEMNCALGSGCSECGGLGAVWDSNDYSQDPDAAPVCQAVVPEQAGWVSVPPKPTDDMVVAFAEAWYSVQQCIDDPQMDAAYAAMLAAAPTPGAAK